MGIGSTKDIRTSHVVSKMVCDPGTIDLDALSESDQKKWFSEHEKRLATRARYEKRRKIFSKFYDVADFEEENIIKDFQQIPNISQEALELCEQKIAELKLSHHLQWLTNERESLMVTLSLYTAPNDFHERINLALRNRIESEPTKFDKVAKNLVFALRCIPYEHRASYRAHICTAAECKNYLIGHTIVWRTFVSTTMLKEIAMEFFEIFAEQSLAESEGKNYEQSSLESKEVKYDEDSESIFPTDSEQLQPILFVINGRSGRKISTLSLQPYEEEVLYPPDCLFRIDKLEKTEQFVTVELTEIDIIRGRKCLLWVDDQIFKEQHKYILDVIQQTGVIPIAKRSSDEAISFLEDPVNDGVLRSRINKFRIITDMSHYTKDGTWDTEGGAKFIRALRREFNYLEPIIVYVKQKKEAKKILAKLNVSYNVFVTSDSTVANDFASFFCDRNFLENNCDTCHD